MLRAIVSVVLWCSFIIHGSFLRAQDHPDRMAQAGVPSGNWIRGSFAESQIFPGTEREYSVYIPAQYDAKEPASLMVFMDGAGYSSGEGAFRVPIVFDNLIHQKAMPVTVAVFINPGIVKSKRDGAMDRSNRSFEYDSLGDRYAKFLIDEFLPIALKDIRISEDPQQRALCGISSGAICAFTVAWERPDQFGKVLSHIGSYTNIRGGWAYPGLVRQTKSNRKAIKVYLQEGREDLDNLHGNWPLGNQDLAAALQFAGYTYKFTMTDGGHSGKWAGEDLPDALRWLWDDKAISTVMPIIETKPNWEPDPDAVIQDVPQGKVIDMPAWESKVFPNTIRDWSIYVPAQYTADSPAALMVFQDGNSMRNPKGRWRVPVVFDNLIARGEMPVTIAVFLNPGHDPAKPRENNKFSNRGYEYDSLGDSYSRFLLEEIIPELEKQYRISKDPEMRAIGGSSSGAICAFNVAWERTDQFGKVYSSVGSFTNLRGGNIFPSWIRKTEPKPIRVYMADTSGDIDNAFGSWPWANRLMAASLKYMGYDLRFDWEEGYGHNADFGGKKFPDAIRWLWRKEKHLPQYDTKGDLGGDLTLLNLLTPGEGWEVAVENLGFADALCADKAGNVYFCDMREPAIYRIDAQSGAKTKIAAESVSGLEFNQDQSKLFGCQGSKNRVISINPLTGETEVVVEDVKPNDLAVTSDGFILITETGKKQVTRIDPDKKTVAQLDVGIEKPNGIALSNDGGTLAVSDYGGEYTWMFRVLAGGELDAKMPTMPMRLPIDMAGQFKFNSPPPYILASKGDGMAVDKKGRYYVTSELGVQIFDPTGRPCGVLPKVDKTQPLTTCILAGADFNTLYIAHGTKIYRRKLKTD